MVSNSCDFCSAAEIAVKEYKCRDFTIAALVKDGEPINVQNSIGNWHACATCARFIDADDSDGLVLHALDKIISRVVIQDARMIAETRRAAMASIIVAHSGFFENRIKE